MLVSLKPIMEYANKHNCAIGAFNCPNLESVEAIIGAAEEMRMPVILNYAEAHNNYIKIEEIGPIMLQYARKTSVPVCVHLDHGQTKEICMKAIRLGFTSLMIDRSADDYEENVRVTREITELAHSLGITVEAELGHIFTSEVGATEGADSQVKLTAEQAYTDPELARDFVKRTGVDVLAIAFGTAHGIYTQKPVLDLDRISQIKEKINIPFVMHGGSGLTKEEFQGAIRNGIRKINYYTYMTMAGARAVQETLAAAFDEPIMFHDLAIIARQAMKEDVKQAMSIFSGL